MTSIIQEASDYLSKIKIQMMRDSKNTFILHVLFGLNIEWDTVQSGGMLSTDGLNMYINPEYFIQRDEDGAISDLAHETYHVCFNHMERAKVAKLNFPRWNVACDYYINLMLRDAGFIIDKTFLIDEKYRDKSIKQIYNSLKNKDIPQNFKPDIIVSDQEKEEAQQAEIKEIISRAVTQVEMSQSYNHLPATLKRSIKNFLNPKLPWNEILMNYMDAYKKDDYSWQKPNRRYMPDYYLPIQYSDNLESIYVAIDTSGSVSERMLDEFIAEIRYIQDTMKPVNMSVHTFDTRLRDFYSLTEGDSLDDIVLTGGGGTKIAPVLSYIKKMQPIISIIITDGYYSKKDINTNSDIIYIIYDNSKFTTKYGKVIHLDN